jgi:hypothetical protein
MEGLSVAHCIQMCHRKCFVAHLTTCATKTEDLCGAPFSLAWCATEIGPIIGPSTALYLSSLALPPHSPVRRAQPPSLCPLSLSLLASFPLPPPPPPPRLCWDNASVPADPHRLVIRLHAGAGNHAAASLIPGKGKPLPCASAPPFLAHGTVANVGCCCLSEKERFAHGAYATEVRHLRGHQQGARRHRTSYRRIRTTARR